MTLTIPSLDSLPAVARDLIVSLHLTSPAEDTSPHVIALYGPMGAGKTTLVAALCRELGVAEPVTSPTFAIVNEYHTTALPSTGGVGEGLIYHFDFYRIRRLEEAYDIGFEDYLYSGHLCLIEWPELIEELLPVNTVRLHIAVNADDTRTATVEVP